MKILVFIFSLYFLVLPCMACAGTELCADDQQNSVIQTTDQHQHEKDDCGSSCDCSCCVHIVSLSYLSPKIIIDKPFVKNKIQYFYNNISLPSNYFGNIWQPPRIS
ncbi:MAG: DUF6660 family protein [Ferruginibacter sp.]